MPANSLPDPSLMFLYLCMRHSDLTKIDFAAVAAATGLNPPAARMRYSRLKKVIESGIVDGKATPKSAESAESDDGPAAAAASPSPAKKQKRTPSKRKRKVDVVKQEEEDGNENDGDDDVMVKGEDDGENEDKWV